MLEQENALSAMKELFPLTQDDKVEMEYIQSAINAFIFIINPNSRGIASSLDSDGPVEYNIIHRLK